MLDELVEWLADALVRVFDSRTAQDDALHGGARGTKRSAAEVEEVIRWGIARALESGVPRALVIRRLSAWRYQLGYKLIGHEALDDALDGILRGLRTPSRSRVQWLKSVVNHLGIVAPAIALLAAIAFGVSYKIFYDRLELTPRDVGLGPAEIIAGSIGGTLLLFFSVTMGLAGAAAPFASAGPAIFAHLDSDQKYRLKPALRRPREWATLVLCALVSFIIMWPVTGSALWAGVWAGLMSAAALAIGLPALWPRATAFGMTTAVVVAALSGEVWTLALAPVFVAFGAVCAPVAERVGDSLRGRPSSEVPTVTVPSIATDSLYYWSGLAICALVAVLAITISPPLLAGRAASQVRSGLELQGVDIFGFGLLDLEARPVTALWQSSDSRERIESDLQVVNQHGSYEIPGCLFMLGRDSANAIILYQVLRERSLVTPGRSLPPVVSRRALRVSDGQVVIATGNSRCNYPRA